MQRSYLISTGIEAGQFFFKKKILDNFKMDTAHGIGTYYITNLR